MPIDGVRGRAGLPIGPFLALDLFVLLAVAGGTPALVAANVAISRWLGSAAVSGVVHPVTAVLSLGSTLVSGALVAGWGAVLLLRGRRLGAVALGLFFVGVAVEVALKAALDHPPVWPEFHRSIAWYPHEGISSEDLGLSGSFPSGHVFRMAFLAVTAAGAVAEWGGGRARLLASAAALALIAAAGVAVVWAGWHWATDALGGAALGYALAALAARVGRREGARQGGDAPGREGGK